jgi:predicted transcriptional regulator
MTAANLKIDLIHKITQLKESYVIDEINRILDFESDKGIFKLNSKQKARLLEGKEEYKAGKVLSEKEANKQIQEWLTK